MSAGVDTRNDLKPVELELWFWEIPDPVTGRWRKTRYRMTEQSARDRFGGGARKIDWTLEVRVVHPDSTFTGTFLGPHT